MRTPLLPYSRTRRPAAGSDAPPLEARDLAVRYPGATAHALEAVSLRVDAGSAVALVGPNGSGKSTLLKTAVGLLKPAAGTLRVFGRPAGACRSLVAYLPQRGELDWRFPIDVRRLVTTGRYVHLGWLRRPGRRDAAIVDAVLDRLGLAGLAGRQIGRLSGGQQQRTLLARALVQEAPLLLLDEPLNAVDGDTRAVILDTFAALRDRGTTLVVATHDHDRLALDFDQVIELGVRGSRLHVPRATCRAVEQLQPAAMEPGTRNLERGSHRWAG
jgi:ABC-type Mn2+/Zn2+ transport system ATPase subunit